MLLPGLFQNPIAVGYQLPLPQWEESDYDPTRGYIIRYEYDGVSQEAMQAMRLNYVSQGIACRLRFSNGRATLEVTDSTQSYTIDNWSLKGEDETLDVLLHPQVAQDLSDSAVNYGDGIAKLQQHIQNGDSQSIAFADTVLAPMVSTLTYYLYPYIIAGLTNYKDLGDGSGYVLRHATNVSNRWPENIADFAVGKVYTTAQLLSEVTDDGLWVNPIEPRLAYKIANIIPPILPPSIAPDWTIGWIKGRSTEETAANNRVDIVQEYTFGQFEFALYKPYDG